MADGDCLFCRIAEGELDTELLYETDDVIAFPDIDPKAPTHLLVIPRQHIPTLDDLDEDQADTVGRLFIAARDLARSRGMAEEGYRLVMNVGSGAGQSVFHIHLHLLGGRPFTWPPG